MIDPVRDAGAACDRDARLLPRLGDALRPLDDAATIRATAVRLIGEALAANRAGYADVDAATGQIVIDADWTHDLPSLAGRHGMEAFGTDQLDRLGAGEVVVHTDDPTPAAGTGVYVPLLRSGELRAIFFLHRRDAHAFAPGELDLVRAAAEHGWLAAENACAHAALRESEARLAATLESVPVGVAMLDNDGRIVLANSEYRRFLPDGVIPSCDPAGRARWSAVDETGAPLAVRDYPGARARRGERTVPGQEMLFRIDDDRTLWTRVASVPIYDNAGRPNGQASVISDIDALKRVSEALRENRARAMLLIEGIAQATWEAAPDGLVEEDSPSWRAFTGQSYDDWKAYGWLAAIHPQDRASTLQKWQETVREGRAVDAEYRLRGKDGDYRWMNVRAVPLHDEAGQIIKWLGMNIDIDERKRLEQSIHDNERRFRALVEGVPQLLWRADRATEWSWASPQWTEFTGQSEADACKRGWLAMLHPDDRDATVAAWIRAEGDGSFDIEHRLRHRDGAYRWFSTRAVPLRDDRGEVAEWLGTSNDIDALRRAQARQGVMVAELQHRTRNLIAVIRSLADKTIDRASSLDEFAQRFNDRLSALSRVQGLLSHASAGRKVSFDELLRSELHALGAVGPDGQGERVTLSGPAGVPLRSAAVQTLALALHELATNAAKYGALAQPGGGLDVTWSVEAGADATRSVLAVEWREYGLDLPDVAVRTAARGYGRELIECALPYQLAAETSYAFTLDGLCCTIRVPIVSVRAGEEEVR